MARLSEWYGRLLDALVVAACVLLLLMTVMIGADVVSRNLGGGGVPMSNEISEDILYLMTLLAAPWLLRQGQHIRVDIILRTLPVRVAWLLEWLGDIVSNARSINIKTLVTPEWWTLAPLPLGFTLLAIEFMFRMHRLASAEVGLRDDAVSAA